MVRLDAKLLTVALTALLVSCGGGPHQPESPAVVPAPAGQPQTKTAPSTPSAPSPKADPKIAPKDSGGTGNYPWQSAPIAAL